MELSFLNLSAVMYLLKRIKFLVLVAVKVWENAWAKPIKILGTIRLSE